MKKDIDQEACWDELMAIWPKKSSELYLAKDRMAFLRRVNTSEDFEKLKNHVECLLEDTAINKLPNLLTVINEIFASNKKSAENQPQVASKPVLDQNELYQKTNDPELSKLFVKIWEVWPRSPDFVERRNLALDAFLATARVLPLADIETACLAYANSFGDGFMVYPKSLRNFLADKELLKEWLDRSRSVENNKIEREQFDIVYSWYPEFSSKNSKKVREASWVMYWRSVKEYEKLDFLAMVKLYRRQRKSEIISRDQSEEEGVTFTKSFVAFVGEFRQMFTGNRMLEAKADIFAYQVIAYAKDLGLDLNNIWSEDDISPFFVRVLTYLCGTVPNIKEVIREGILRTVNLVNEVKANPKKYNDIARLDQAIQEVNGLDVDSFSSILYKKVCEEKLFETPTPEVKES